MMIGKFLKIFVVSLFVIIASRFLLERMFFSNEHLNNLNFLKNLTKNATESSEFVAGFRSSVSMATTTPLDLFIPYMCRDGNRTWTSEYVNYEGYPLFDETNVTMRDSVVWSYRLGLYQFQLDLMRAMRNDTLQRAILKTTNNKTVTCFNPVRSINSSALTDSAFSHLSAVEVDALRKTLMRYLTLHIEGIQTKMGSAAMLKHFFDSVDQFLFDPFNFVSPTLKVGRLEGCVAGALLAIGFWLTLRLFWVTPIGEAVQIGGDDNEEVALD